MEGRGNEADDLGGGANGLPRRSGTGKRERRSRTGRGGGLVCVTVTVVIHIISIITPYSSCCQVSS